MEQNPLFRKAAIEKLASPERLDVLMQVTSPKGWIAMWTFAILLAGVVLWSMFGSIPTRIDGDGILIRGGSLRELRSGGDGVLTRFQIRINDSVQPEQVLGEIAQQDIEDRVRGARAKYEEAGREYQASRAEDEATIAGIRATIAGHQADIDRTTAELARVNDDLVAKRESLKKGLITASRVQAIERDSVNQQGKITSLRATINSLYANIRGVEQRIRARAAGVDAAKLETDRLSNLASGVSQLRSTVAGRVVELKKRAGDRVSTGEVVAVVEPPSSLMEPVIYVNSATGKRIQGGMEAQIAPSTVKREEYGFMKGTVRSVGEYPVTPDAMMAVVANQSLAQELLGNTAKLEVRISLIPSPKTSSGYEWSSSEGPPFKIESGTRVTVSMVVDRRAPISFVLPIIRGALGAS